jgi:hypothetical protein
VLTYRSSRNHTRSSLQKKERTENDIVRKYNMRHFPVSVLLSLVCLSCFAQQKACEAYWVVETNKKINYSIIRLYDANHNTIEERRFDGVIVDIRSKRIVRRLNRLVDLYYKQTDRVPEKLSQLRGRSSRPALPRRRQSGQVSICLKE